MSQIDSRGMGIINDVLQMGEGWVLDFTDRTFAAFFREEFEVDINDAAYKTAGRSKAKRLRSFLQITEPPRAGMVLARLLERRLSGSNPDVNPVTLAAYRELAESLGASQASAGVPTFPTTPISQADPVEDLLDHRLAELQDAVHETESQDARNRDRVIERGEQLAELCRRGNIRQVTQTMILSSVGDEEIYGHLGVGPEGLYIAFRSSSEDDADAFNNIPQPWGFTPREPQVWPVEWLRKVIADGKLDELMDGMLAKLRVPPAGNEATGEPSTEVVSEQTNFAGGGGNTSQAHAVSPSATTTGPNGNAEGIPKGPVVSNPTRNVGDDFLATVVFVLINGLKDTDDGPAVPKALAALNAAARAVPSKAYVLSTIAGLIIVIPDALSWSLDEALGLLRGAKVGFGLRVGVAHGSVDVVDDIDDQRNLVGPAINSAARIATSTENPGGLVHESYANLLAPTLSPDHWLHKSKRVEKVVTGKVQDKPFKCYVVPGVFAPQPLEQDEAFNWVPAVLIAYDLPTFSGGDRSALRKRFTRLGQVFKRLWQTAPAPALLSPGGDGGVVVMREVSLAAAGEAAERLRKLANSESLDHADSIAVRLRIGVHYGHITEYRNARGISRPAGLELFIADDIAGDEIARGKKDIIVTAHLADAIADGNNEELTAMFEQLAPILKGPAMGVSRFVRRGSLENSPTPVPSTPVASTQQSAKSSGFPVTAPFEPLETQMLAGAGSQKGTPVVPSLWRIAAVPAGNRNWTKAQLYEAIEAVTPSIAADFGRRTRVPIVLQQANETRRDDGTQVRRIVYGGAATNERHEEQFGTRSDGAIWFQHAHFWDATETWLDLGQCAFDVMAFLRVLIGIGSRFRVASYNVTLTVEAPRADMVATIQTRGLAPKQEMRTARINGRRHEGKIEVGPSTSLPEPVQAGLVKQLVDAIANECVLGEDAFYRAGSGAPFLEISAASILSVLESFK